MNKFINYFNKAGGMNLIKQYRRAHVLLFAMFQLLFLGTSKKSLEILRLAVSNKILCKLRKKYRKYISHHIENNKDLLQRNCSNKVWICWLQGIENAPDVVKKCYDSICKNLHDREIVTINEENYKNYVVFPDHIQRKIDNGIITRTHFSDLLRLELLLKYGGTWIDATVFCSGDDFPEYIINSELFVYRCLKPGLDGQCVEISSWLMTACTNNPIIRLTRDLLYEYWRKYNYMIDYYLIHYFFQLAIETYSEEWAKVVPCSNSTPHILLLRLFDEYDEDMWFNIKQLTCFHKLTYKFDEREINYSDTFYKKILV